MYSYVTRMSLARIRMSSVYHSYVFVYHPYVTRMYSHFSGMSLVCGFAINNFNISVAVKCPRDDKRVCSSYVTKEKSIIA